MNLDKGLLLTVWRPARPDAEFGLNVGVRGPTSRNDQVVVVGVQVGQRNPVTPLLPYEQAYPVADDAPAMVLTAPGTSDSMPTLTPLEHIDPTAGTQMLPKGCFSLMPSGNYAGSDDSRWANLGTRVGFNMRLALIPVYDTLVTVDEWVAMRDEMAELIKRSKEVEQGFEK